MTKKFISSLMLSMMAIPSLLAADYGLPANIQDGNILHCFDWTFSQIKTELPNIAQAGFGSVQVSPVQGNCANNAEWYYAYMPYDFVFKANGSGSRAELQSLCSEAAKYGIKIVVDVVANHVNQASGYHDTWWDSNGRVRWKGGIDYGNRYSITHGQLGDYGDVNSEASEVQQRAKAFIDDLKSLGVKGIRWDAAKHIGLPSESCNFWPTVCSDASMWHYGEILDSPGGDGNSVMKEYTKYMSVTDNGYCTGVRNAVNGGGVPSNHAGWAAGTIAANKVVYWAESHDDYSNEWQASTNVSQAVIDRAWAITACREGSSSLYFSRPSGTSRNAIKMGQKGSTHFTSKEIAAINHLRNAAVGKADYFSSSNGVVCVTRQGVGAAIIVGAGNSRSVSVPNGGGYVPAGTYTDEVSGATFTVTSSTISGNVGSTGIAVIYDATAMKQPAMTFTPAGGSFKTETLSVTANLINATSGWYKIDGGAQVNVTGTATFTIGSGVAVGSTIKIDWSATGSEGTKTGSVTFTKADPNATVTVYYNNPNNWSSVKCYAYKDGGGEVASWPGEAMTKSGSLWSYDLPDDFQESCKVIFNNGGSNQYPGANEPGLDVAGKSMILEGTNWKEYSGSVTPTPDPDPDPTPTPSGNYVYFDNSNSNWSTPYIHYWGGSSKSSWPGVAMTLHSGNVWKYEVADGTTGILFNAGDGDATKTSDFTCVIGHIYNTSGDQGAYGSGGDDPDPTPTPDPDPDPTPTPTPTPSGDNLINDYYKVNPNGCVGSNKSMTITSTNTGDKANISQWTAAELIATGAARDVCQAFKGVHERPIIDAYGLFAAYDSKNLYLGLQTVYTVWDEWGEGFQAGESKPYNMDGKLCWAFNLGTGNTINGTVTNGSSIWQDAEYTTFDNGTDCIWFGSTKPGVGDPGLFFSDGSGKSNYDDPRVKKGANVRYSYASGLNSVFGGKIYGPKAFGNDLSQEVFESGANFTDLSTEVSRLGGNEQAHTFYEFSFPLADLGITESYIKQYGIGVMFVSFYGSSAHESLPYDPSFYDNVFESYSKDPSSSMEKEDKETVTFAHARVGKLAQSSIDSVAADNDPAAAVIVKAANGSIFVAGLDSQRVMVAAIDGKVCFNSVADGSLSIPVNPGIYVVSIDGRGTRVLVK